MLKLCCKRGAENQTCCGTYPELLFCVLLFLSLHVLLFWHTNQHHQDQPCLWKGRCWPAQPTSETRQYRSWHWNASSGQGRSGTEVKPEQGGSWRTGDKLFTLPPSTPGNWIGSGQRSSLRLPWTGRSVSTHAGQLV